MGISVNMKIFCLTITLLFVSFSQQKSLDTHPGDRNGEDFSGVDSGSYFEDRSGEDFSGEDSGSHFGEERSGEDFSGEDSGSYFEDRSGEDFSGEDSGSY